MLAHSTAVIASAARRRHCERSSTSSLQAQLDVVIASAARRRHCERSEAIHASSPQFVTVSDGLLRCARNGGKNDESLFPPVGISLNFGLGWERTLG